MRNHLYQIGSAVTVFANRFFVSQKLSMKLGLLLCLAWLSYGAAFQNGSFELGTPPNFDLPGGSIAITGWVVTGGLIAWVGGDGAGGGPSDGGLFVDLNGCAPPESLSCIVQGGIQQTFDTTVGTSYTVKFDLRSNNDRFFGPPIANTVRVSAAGTAQNFSTPISAWQTFTFTFTATASQTTLAFVSLSPGTAGPELDNVKVSGGLGAPTNFRAIEPQPQFNVTGDRIELSWDYGTDPIDGFSIDSMTPSGNWLPLATVASPQARSYTDSNVPPFATVSYRIRAYQGNAPIYSDYSDVATCFQISIETILSNTRVVATFQPDVTTTVSAVAQAFSYDHFNWVSVVNLDPSGRPLTDSAGNLLTVPYLDPPLGGYGNPYVPADLLPYYRNELAQFDGFINSPAAGGNQHTSTSTNFADQPAEPLLPPNGYLGFLTTLVGVRNVVGADPTVSVPDYTGLINFAWYSNYDGISAGGVIFRSVFDPYNPLSVPASEGIFNLQLVTNDELPNDARTFLRNAGMKGIPSPPKIDRDAPMTAAFLSGPLGANGWYAGPVSVQLIATDIDGPSDIASTTYNLDGGPAISYIAPLTVAGDGVHVTQFGSVDIAGNAETPRPERTIKIDATPPNISCSATPNVLWPPNGKQISITVSGSFVDVASGVDSSRAAFSVVDEYGQLQPSGNIVLSPTGHYSFDVSLISSRDGNDIDGRQYTIVVAGKDSAGNAGSCSALVLVPHDQRN